MSFGVTQITCWPFQYLMRLSDCSVEMMSSVLIADMDERSLIERVPRKSLRICNSTDDQYDLWLLAYSVNGPRRKKIYL